MILIKPKSGKHCAWSINLELHMATFSSRILWYSRRACMPGSSLSTLVCPTPLRIKQSCPTKWSCWICCWICEVCTLNTFCKSVFPQSDHLCGKWGCHLALFPNDIGNKQSFCTSIASLPFCHSSYIATALTLFFILFAMIPLFPRLNFSLFPFNLSFIFSFLSSLSLILSFQHSPSLSSLTTFYISLVLRNTMTDNLLCLFCVVNGESMSFSVEIDWAKTVDHLKKAIKAEKSPQFDDVTTNEITLWHVSILDDELGSTIMITALDDKTALSNLRTWLYKLFPKSPDDNTYILVQWPSQGNVKLCFCFHWPVIQRPASYANLNSIASLLHIVHTHIPAQASTPLPGHLSDNSRPGTPLSGMYVNHDIAHMKSCL